MVHQVYVVTNMLDMFVTSNLCDISGAVSCEHVSHAKKKKKKKVGHLRQFWNSTTTLPTSFARKFNCLALVADIYPFLQYLCEFNSLVR